MENRSKVQLLAFSVLAFLGVSQMKIEYDKEIDAVYIRIQEKKVAHTKEIEEGINLDIDNEGKIIGLEIIGAIERYN